MDNKIRKSIIIFSIISILSGWLGVLVDTLLTDQPEGNSLGMLLWLVLPLLSAILIRIIMKDSWKSLGLKLSLKGNLKWYLVSIIIFPIITVILLSIGSATKWIDSSMFKLSDFAIVFIGALVGNFIKNIFEELAWRGFLTERLINLQFSDIKIYIIATMVWFSWHIPYYLFLLPQSTIGGSRIGTLFSAFLILGSWSVMFTELYRLTRSIWPCVILHAVVNSIATINSYISIEGGKGIFISYDSGIISLVLCICIGVLMRNYRIKNRSNETELNKHSF